MLYSESELRSVTEATRRGQNELEQAVQNEGKKNEQYQKLASEYAVFSEHNDISAQGMNSLMSIPRESEHGQQAEDRQDSGEREDCRVVKDET